MPNTTALSMIYLSMIYLSGPEQKGTETVQKGTETVQKGTETVQKGTILAEVAVEADDCPRPGARPGGGWSVAEADGGTGSGARIAQTEEG